MLTAQARIRADLQTATFYTEGVAGSAAFGTDGGHADVFKIAVSAAPDVSIIGAAQLTIDPAGDTTLQSFTGNLDLTGHVDATFEATTGVAFIQGQTGVGITSITGNAVLQGQNNTNIVAVTGDVTIQSNNANAHIDAVNTFVSSLAGSGGLVLSRAADGELSTTSAGTDGQIPIAATGDIIRMANITAGPGIVIGNAANQITVSAAGAGFTWTVITGAAQIVAVENGYIANRGAGVVFTLPTVAAVGDVFRITCINAGGWSLIEGVGQSIQFGNQSTTVTAGSLSSTAIGDTVEVVCTVANTGFLVLSSMGNITIV